MSLHAGTTQKSECPTISGCPTPQPLTCPPEPTPESIPGSVAILLKTTYVVLILMHYGDCRYSDI